MQTFQKLLKLKRQNRFVEELTKLFKKIRERFGNKVEKIILFGSYARGDYGKDSDIDLLIIVNDRKIEYELRKIVYSFIPSVGRLISVKVIERKDYEMMNKMSFSFVKSVKREGVIVG